MFRQSYDLQGTKGLVSVNIEGGSAPITSSVSSHFVGTVVDFSHVELVQHLEAEDLVLINALAPISGDFRTHRSLSIQTTQGWVLLYQSSCPSGY